jgi:hypothetical protein
VEKPEILYHKLWPTSIRKRYHEKEIIEFLKSEFVDVDVDTIVKSICERKLININCDDLSQKKYFELRTEADEKSNKLLISSVIDRKNVIWETTGANLSWIMYAIYFMKEYNYVIIVVIPITRLNQLIERCKARPQTANCSDEYLSSMRMKSYTNFPEIAGKCDRVLIFDNVSRLFLIYDSLDDYCNKINSLKSDPNQTPLHEYYQSRCTSSRL